MKIVILDGYTSNPGDLSWEGLQRFGEVTVYDRSTPDQIVPRSKDADIIINNKNLLTADVLRQLPNLKYIGLLSTGVNVVDLAMAREQGVTVTNIPAYSTDSVAQLVFAFLLQLCSRVAEHDRAVHNGDWANCIDFSFTVAPLQELAGMTIGIVGLGDIGIAVAKIARAFNMNVIAYTRTPKNMDGVALVDLDTLFATADVVTLHCPLNEKTDKLVNTARLATMKDGAFLINTGRGGLVDEDALAGALNAGKLGGAGLDVLSAEPPKPENPLLAAKNCLITPHIAWATKAARSRLMQTLEGNIAAYLNGTPQNVVN